MPTGISGLPGTDIESFATSVLSNLVANLMSAGLLQLGKIMVSGRTRGQNAASTLEKDWDLRTAVQKSSAQMARALQSADPTDTTKIKIFLTTSEVEVILRQVFACRLLAPEACPGVDEVGKVFAASFHLHTRINNPQLAADIWASLLSAAETAIKTAADKGILGAHETLSSLRHEKLISCVSDIQANLDLLTGKIPHLSAIMEFEEKYRAQVAERFHLISPPNFERNKRFPIAELYVDPTFSTDYEGGFQLSLETEDLLDRMHRAVILGNPGGGKTTFASKLVFDFSTTSRFQGRQVTPIVVVLRDFGVDQRDRGSSIIQFMISKCNAIYQLNPPPFALEYMLRNGRAMVIFDGIDELLETAQRQEVRDAVEAFCNLYPSAPTLVTSRQIGYEQAPLDPQRFDAFKLNEFGDEQVEDYVQKWFLVDDNLDEREKKELALAFLQESQSVPDLRSNPLMLGLMCSIYREENFIPANRPEVYKKCAMMLFERWDRSRRIKTTFSYEDDLSPLMAYLAHWIYADKKLQGGVTGNQLVGKAADYLRSRFATSEKARATAEEFIEFSKGRAWIFTDTGTSESGDSLYQFTHRTFLEYFTALFLFRTNPRPADLLGVLLPKITKREWDMVAQLAFHIQSRETEGAADALMKALIMFGAGPSPERVNTISFAARCLEFIRVAPDIAQALTNAAFDIYLAVRSQLLSAPPLPELKSSEEDPLEFLFGNLMRAQIAARESIAEALLNLFVQTISGQNEVQAAIGCEALFRIVASYRRATLIPRDHRPHTNAARAEVEEYWRAFRLKVFRICAPKIRELAMKYAFIARAAYMIGYMDLVYMLRDHGVGAIFEEQPSSFRQCYYTALGQRILFHFTEYDRELCRSLFSDEVEDLSQIGSALSAAPLPWANSASYARLIKSWGRGTYREPEVKVDFVPLNADALFGLFALAAAAAETLCQVSGQEVAFNAFKRLKLEERAPIMEVIVKWFSREPTDIEKLTENSRLSAQQIQIISDWLNHKVKLLSGESSQNSSSGEHGEEPTGESLEA
ncbi:MAG: NACHT domain-containing protein [Acidobacteriia bacterium]|nr:NACHT domain-containing protein [Terriglobia bacterium]